MLSRSLTRTPYGAGTPAWTRGTPTARTHSYGLLSAACTTAVSDGLLNANPCSNSGASHTHAQRQPQILTVGEWPRSPKIEPAGFRALVLICAWA